MARHVLVILALGAMLAWGQAMPTPGREGGAQKQDEAGAVRFTAFDVVIETPSPIAAYQVEVTGGAGISLVGVEGGGAPAFAEPPYYDAALLHAGRAMDRIVIADYSLDETLPSGTVRVARLHLMVRGQVELKAELAVAAGADEDAIDATIRLFEHESD